MKTFQSAIKLFFLPVLLIGMQSFIVLSGIEGIWAFEVENAPYGYEKGEIIITKEGDVFKAVVSGGYGKISGEKVTVDGSKVVFDIYVETVKVEISIDIDGDNFTGKASSGEGLFKLVGKRK